MAGSKQKHDWLVNKLYEHPEIVDVKGEISSKSKEVALLYRGHLLTIPDLVINNCKHKYFFEVKSSNNPNLYSKGMSQLEKIAFWHQHRGLPEPHIELIMPHNRTYKLWIDMLRDLDRYKLGDEYKGN